MGHQGKSQRRLETPRKKKNKNPLPKAWGILAQVNPSLRVPAEGTSPAPARVTKAGGIVPVQPRLSIPGVGSGATRSFINLETLPGSHVTAAGDNNKLLFQIREREGQRKAETTGLGAAKLPITAKSGHGVIFSPQGGVFIVPAGGREGVALGHPSQ